MDKPENLIPVYLIIGVAWVTYNSRSHTFGMVLSRAREHGQMVMVFLALLLGTLFWPVGLIGSMLLDLYIWYSAKNQDGGDDGPKGQGGGS